MEIHVLAKRVDRHDDAGLALNTAKDQIATFALSRFRRIEATGQTFTRPADFNAETYAKQAFGIGEKLRDGLQAQS